MELLSFFSTNDGLSFEQIEGQVKDADIRTSFGIVKSDVNPSKVLFLVFLKSCYPFKYFDFV